MTTRVLGRTGLQVGPLGFGAAPLGGSYGPFDETEASAAVRHAIDRGITLIDTSPYYGLLRSEELLGRTLADGWRQKVILCTKAGRNTLTEFDFSREAILRSVEGSLRRLNTDYVDVLQAHDIE